VKISKRHILFEYPDIGAGTVMQDYRVVIGVEMAVCTSLSKFFKSNMIALF